MHHEIELINSIIESGDIAPCIEQNLDYVFSNHADIWAYVVNWYLQYKQPPTKQIVKKHFSEFEMLNVSGAPLQYYIDEAKKYALARGVNRNIQEAIEILKNNGPNAALNYLSTSSNRLLRDNGALKDTNLVSDYSDRVGDFKNRLESGRKVFGVPSGISPIDEIYGGFQPSDFVVIMGWTASCKSWLATLLACNAWRAGYTPLMISLEMNRYQMGYRLDTILGGGEAFTNSDLTHARGLTADAYEEWALKTFDGKHPIHLVTADGLGGAATQQTVEAKIEQYDPDLVILDYHGLFEDARRGGTETEKSKHLSTDFKKIATRTEKPIIDIAAVTMQDGHEDRPPELREVAWSKQLAYDSDLVLAVHREPDSNTIQVVSRKVRRCPDFAFYLDWDIDKGVWSEIYGASTGFGF